MEWTTRKRSITTRSPDTVDQNKKPNLNKTPTKTLEPFEIMAEEISKSVKSEQYAKMLEDAPEWFKKSYTFLINTVTEDLAKIHYKIEAVNIVQAQCNTNTAELKSLQAKITKLETSNKDLETRLRDMEIRSRKNNLILRGCAESGPNESVIDVVSKFLIDQLGIADSDIPMIPTIYRINQESI